MTARNFRLQMAGSQRGFTLIEALIAFVVLAIGVLGIISLLIMSKNALHQSNQRTIAVNLADAMVERIRINPLAVTSYVTGSTPLGGGSLSQPSPDCNSTSCTSTQLAAFDLWNWEQALDGAAVQEGSENVGGLISPRACITFTAAPGKTNSGQLQVSVQWQGLSKSSDGVATGETACGGADAGTDPYRRQVTSNTIVLDESEIQ